MRKMLTEILKNLKSIASGISDFFFIKSLPAFVSSLAVFLFGMNNAIVLQALVVLVIIDFITGVLGAYLEKEVVTSRKAVKSAYKLVVYALLVAGAHVASIIIPVHLFLDEIVTSFLALTELISIIENTGKMGYAIPKKLLNKLQVLRNEQ